MNAPKTQAPDRRLRLLVPDSGRTWSVLYNEITQIPPKKILLGDVFIVRNPPHEGVMFLQATRPNGSAWKLDALELGVPD